MKSILILINFALAFIGLCVSSSTYILIPIIMLAWFFWACYILHRAHKSGTMDKLFELLNIEDL